MLNLIWKHLLCNLLHGWTNIYFSRDFPKDQNYSEQHVWRVAQAALRTSTFSWPIPSCRLLLLSSGEIQIRIRENLWDTFLFNLMCRTVKEKQKKQQWWHTFHWTQCYKCMLWWLFKAFFLQRASILKSKIKSENEVPVSWRQSVAPSGGDV